MSAGTIRTTLAILIAIWSQSEANYNAESWKEAADYLLKSTDQSVDKCENFYQYACGNYGDNNSTKYQQSTADSMGAMYRAVRKTIDELKNWTDTTGTDFQAILVKSMTQCEDSLKKKQSIFKYVYEAFRQRFGDLQLFSGGSSSSQKNDKPRANNNNNNKKRVSRRSTDETRNDGRNGTGKTNGQSPNKNNGKNTRNDAPGDGKQKNNNSVKTSANKQQTNDKSGPSEKTSTTTKMPVKRTEKKTQKPSDNGKSKTTTTTKKPTATKSQKFNPAALLGQLTRELGVPFLMQPTVLSFDDGQSMDLLIGQDGENLFQPTGNASALIAYVANELGVNLDRKSFVNARLIKEYAQLNNALKEIGPMGSPEQLNLNNLTNAATDFDWKSYLNALLPPVLLDKSGEEAVDDGVTFYVRDLQRANKLAGVLAGSTSEAIKMTAFITLVSEIDKMLYFSFGRIKDDPGMICAVFAMKFMSVPLTRIYFDSNNMDLMEYKQEVETMGRNIFAAFTLLINGADWINDVNKNHILDKLQEMYLYSGIPSYIADDDEVANRTHKFDTKKNIIGNILDVLHKRHDENMMQLVDGENLEPEPSFDVNARYINKRVSISLGFMFPPLFKPSYPLAVKYGSLGWVIGHEIQHGYDNTNILLGDSLDDEWLDQDTLDKYEEIKQCVVKQYSMYCLKELGQCINGEATVANDMSDIEGLKLSYAAFKFLEAVVGHDPPLPGMLNYTSDEVFFMAAARTWCSRNLPPTSQFDGAAHSPDRARVEVTFRNVRNFGTAFKCPFGGRAVPAQVCNVWGELQLENVL